MAVAVAVADGMLSQVVALVVLVAAVLADSQIHGMARMEQQIPEAAVEPVHHPAS